jgi:hypothetical protein
MGKNVASFATLRKNRNRQNQQIAIANRSREALANRP